MERRRLDPKTAAGPPAAVGARDADAAPMASLMSIWIDVFRNARHVTIGEVVDRFADRGFGLLLVALALPTLIPVLPPGTAALIGLAYMTLAIQMLWGAHRPWVPKRVRNLCLSAGATRALHALGVSTIGRMARATRGGRGWQLPERVYTRTVALVVLLLGFLLLTPMPFLNTLPAIAVMVLGVGLLNHDGLMVLAGVLVAAGVGVVAVIGTGTLFVFVRHILLIASRGR